MTPSATEAAAALRDIDAARDQSRLLLNYRIASPYSLLLGAIWLLGGLVPEPIPANFDGGATMMLAGFWMRRA